MLHLVGNTRNRMSLINSCKWCKKPIVTQVQGWWFCTDCEATPKEWYENDDNAISSVPPPSTNKLLLRQTLDEQDEYALMLRIHVVLSNGITIAQQCALIEPYSVERNVIALYNNLQKSGLTLGYKLVHFQNSGLNWTLKVQKSKKKQTRLRWWKWVTSYQLREKMDTLLYTYNRENGVS